MISKHTFTGGEFDHNAYLTIICTPDEGDDPDEIMKVLKDMNFLNHKIITSYVERSDASIRKSSKEKVIISISYNSIFDFRLNIKRIIADKDMVIDQVKGLEDAI
jgi:hypothetical protein